MMLAGCEDASMKQDDASIPHLFPDQLTSPLAHVVREDKRADIANILAEREVCRSEASKHRQTHWLIVSNGKHR
jgi:hypothetical protein